MTRIATIPYQNSLSASIDRAQRKLSDTQLALNSGKKAQDLADLGGLAERNLSARSLLTRQQAQTGEAKQLGTTLSLYDTNITAIDTLGSGLRESLMKVVGTGNGESVQGSIEGAFAQFRAALNASDGRDALFGGAQGDTAPFRPRTLAETAGQTTATAFANDQVRASARVADGQDMTYGVLASELGGDMLAAFRTLAEAGPFGDRPTETQLTAMKTAISQIDTALPNVRNVNAGNGLRQTQLETLEERGTERENLLSAYLSENEDADYGQIAIDLSTQKTMLQASYSVFGQLSGLSLVNYLK